MLISEFKQLLSSIQQLRFFDMHGQAIPAHFHVTELGLIQRHSIDCGKDIHQQTLACFQIWVANDVEHRLSPEGMLHVIDLSKAVLGDTDAEIEVEFQSDTIGRYSLIFINGAFHLQGKHTDCLAKEKCGIPEPQTKRKISLIDLGTENAACCTPGGNCC